MPDRRLQAIFFDLDGTFADTAPDLGGALNRLREDAGRPPLPLAELRPWVSQGVRGMLRAGFGLLPDSPGYRDHYDRFLAHYQGALCAETQVFDGIAPLVERIEACGLHWGIVTNKSQRFTLPLMEALGYRHRAACLVSGDSAPRAKPHASPLLLACALAGCDPRQTLYVGDDRRDIDAGRAADMRTVIAAYGYLGDGGPLADWGADHTVDHPAAIAALANLA